MSGAHSHDIAVPRPALLGLAALVGLSLAMTAAVSAGWLSREAVPAVSRAAAQVQPVRTRTLVFADVAGGAVRISDAQTGAEVALIETETQGGGFIRGVLRGMARERRMHAIGSAAPFTLTLWADGSLSLADPATGRSVELGAFGPDNRLTFLRLIAPEAAR